MSERIFRWSVRLTAVLVGGTMLQAGSGCTENTSTLIAQGVAGLISSVVNQLIATAFSDLFGLPTTSTPY